MSATKTRTNWYEIVNDENEQIYAYSFDNIFDAHDAAEQFLQRNPVNKGIHIRKVYYIKEIVKQT